MTQPPDGRKEAVDCEELASELRAHGTEAEIIAIQSIEDALNEAQKQSIELDSELPQPILCIGSVYLIGAILKLIDEDGLMEFQNILVAPKGEDGIDPVA